MRSAQLGGPQRIPRPEGARPGPPTEWSHLERITLDDVVGAVVGRAPSEVSFSGGGPRPSAVLCAVFAEDDQAQVVLTRRSSKLRSHTGEVSFPGGRMERGESALDAARREAHEEVGLDPGSVTPVGRLSTLTTSINPAPITPIVATLPGRPRLVPNPDEVDRIFTMALVTLVDPEVHHSELWTWTDGVERRMDFFDLEGDTVWGATARMLCELLDWVADAPNLS
ncbi:MAG: CoA pyrophosphatase [Actinomycetota bacterium]|nr:CoA pyrophosphatase [Actinomycetota bacterium]